MSKKDFNLPLLRKAVEWAESEARKPQSESEWYQAMYHIQGYRIGRTCGTAHCIAGYVAEAHCLPEENIWPKAAQMLGIDADDAWGKASNIPGLFEAGNTIQDVRSIAERIARKYGEEL